MKKKKEKEHFNARVASSRGNEWLENLKRGKMEAKANPSFLAEARAAKGIRQIDIAERLQMSLSTYCAIERGKRLVKDIFAKHICAEVGVKLGQIFEAREGKKWVAMLRNENQEKKAKKERKNVSKSSRT